MLNQKYSLSKWNICTLIQIHSVKQVEVWKVMGHIDRYYLNYKRQVAIMSIKSWINQLRVSQEYYNMYVEKVMGVIFLFGRARPKLQRYGCGIGWAALPKVRCFNYNTEYKFMNVPFPSYHISSQAPYRPTFRQSAGTLSFSVSGIPQHRCTYRVFRVWFFGFVLLSRQVTTVCTLPCLILISP